MIYCHLEQEDLDMDDEFDHYNLLADAQTEKQNAAQYAEERKQGERYLKAEDGGKKEEEVAVAVAVSDVEIPKNTEVLNESWRYPYGKAVVNGAEVSDKTEGVVNGNVRIRRAGIFEITEHLT